MKQTAAAPFYSSYFLVAPKKSLLSPTGSTFGFCSVPNLKLHQYPVTATSFEPATKPDKEYISEDGKLVKVLKIEEPTGLSRCKEKTKKGKLTDSLKQEKIEKICESGNVVVGKVEKDAKETSKALVLYDHSTCNFIDTLNSEILKVKELVKKNVIKNKKPFENKVHKTGKSSNDATYVQSKENTKSQFLKRYDMRETRSFIKQKQKEREERENEEKKKKASETEERKKKLIELKEKQKKILQSCKRRVINEKPQWVGPLEVVPRQKKKLPINRRFRSLQRNNNNLMRQNTSVIRTQHENEARGDYRYSENGHVNEFMTTSEDLSSIKTSKSESAISFVNYAFVDYQGRGNIRACEDLSHIVRSESLKQKDSFYPLDHLKNAQEALRKRLSMENSATSLSLPVSKYLKAVPWKQALADDPSRPKTPHWLKDLSQDPDPFNLINTFKRKLQSLEDEARESHRTKSRSQTRMINSSVPSFENIKLSTLKSSEFSNMRAKVDNSKEYIQEKTKSPLSQLSRNSLKSSSTDYLIENYQKLIKGEKPCKKGKKRNKREKKNVLVRVCSEDFELMKNDSSDTNYKSISDCSSKSTELPASEYYLANSDFTSFHSDSYKNLSESTKASDIFLNQNVNMTTIHTDFLPSQCEITKEDSFKLMQAFKDEDKKRQFLNHYESSLINKAKVCIAEMEARKQKLIGKGKESEIVFLRKQERELMLKLYDDLKEVFRIRKLEKEAEKNKAKEDLMQMVPSALNKSIIMSSPTISDPVSEILNNIDDNEKIIKRKNSMEKIVSTILKTPLSPRLTIMKRCDSAKSEESLALSSELISDKSDTEVRVSTLQHQLKQRKAELDKLRKEYQKSKRERLLSKEQSLIHQIQAYDTYIDQVKKELQSALKNKEEKFTKPLIKQPKCLEKKKSGSSISTQDVNKIQNAFGESILDVSERIVSPAITEAKDQQSSDETITDETIILSKDVCNQTDQAYFEGSLPTSLILECESAQESKIQEYIAEEKILSDFLESAIDYIPSKMEQNKIISQLLQPVTSLDKMLYTVSLEDISAEASYPTILHEDDKMEASYLQYNVLNTYDIEDSESDSFDDTVTQILLCDNQDELEEMKANNIAQNIFTFVINEATDAALNAFNKKKRYLQSQGDGVLAGDVPETVENVGWHGEGSNGEEREALNLQQLQIEHQIQEIDAQEAVYFIMTPFYEYPRVPAPSEEQVLFYISQAVEIIWKRDTEGVQLTEINIPDNFMLYNNDGSFREFMFDFTKDLYLKFKPPKENKPPWAQIPIKPLPPIRTKNEILKYIEKEAKIILGFESIPIKENMIMKWSRKKRDFVDEILIKELRDDESNWTNYKMEENTIKNKISEFLIDKTLTEAVIGLSNAFTVFSNNLRFLDV